MSQTVTLENSDVELLLTLIEYAIEENEENGHNTLQLDSIKSKLQEGNKLKSYN